MCARVSLCLPRLASLSLLPEETPEMTFTADARSLREAITSFGSVSAQVWHAGDCSNRSTHFSTVCKAKFTASQVPEQKRHGREPPPPARVIASCHPW